MYSRGWASGFLLFIHFNILFIVHYADEDKTNNSIFNLFYVPMRYNTYLSNISRRKGMYIYTDNTVFKMLTAYLDGARPIEIGRIFGQELHIPKERIEALIVKICNADARADAVSKYLRLSGYNCYNLFTESQINEITAAANSGMFNTSYQVLSSITWLRPFTLEWLGAGIIAYANMYNTDYCKEFFLPLD